MSWITDLVLGLIVAAVIALVIALGVKRSHLPSYDERQTAARGKAYRAGFYTLLAAMAVLIFLLTVTEDLPLTREAMAVLAFAALCLGAVVFACTAIWHDAYIGLTESPGRYKGMILILTAVNLAVGGIELYRSDFFAEGIVFSNCSSLLVGIMGLIILITLLVKQYADRRAETE